ncbi:putative UDP-glucose 4-epimerase [Apostichopus japonicus]|uniref:UDP-glucose 4-epimerase n=1 Tax=Stichopus japonicus TaxID=307972 RepID=A0A2G8L068_STIJA|nr:putative UDP-glucose 4-epimerase [Apostichopus japonicus]
MAMSDWEKLVEFIHFICYESQVMKEFNVVNIVFSSSATVYGTPDYLPIDEKHPVGRNLTNCYGRTKYFLEQVLTDVYSAEKEWNVILLRYFNPVGAHKSGEIGENPIGEPDNLMPYTAQVASGKREYCESLEMTTTPKTGQPATIGVVVVVCRPISVCVCVCLLLVYIYVCGARDYIHVLDLAAGHVAALNKTKEKCGFKIYNLGTGISYTVLEMISAFEKVIGKKVSHKICPRRSGDVDTILGNPSLAERELKWKAKRGLQEMCEDLWRWQTQHPEGYVPQ